MSMMRALIALHDVPHKFAHFAVLLMHSATSTALFLGLHLVILMKMLFVQGFVDIPAHNPQSDDNHQHPDTHAD